MSRKIAAATIFMSDWRGILLKLVAGLVVVSTTSVASGEALRSNRQIFGEIVCVQFSKSELLTKKRLMLDEGDFRFRKETSSPKAETSAACLETRLLDERCLRLSAHEGDCPAKKSPFAFHRLCLKESTLKLEDSYSPSKDSTPRSVEDSQFVCQMVSHGEILGCGHGLVLTHWDIRGDLPSGYEGFEKMASTFTTHCLAN